MMTRGTGYGDLGVVHVMARAGPMLGMRLAGLLDRRQSSMLLWVLYFLSFCDFFILSLLLSLLLCLELV